MSVTLKVYDLQGRVVLSKDRGVLAAGDHAIKIEADKLRAGAYFFRLRMGSKESVNKFAVVR